MGHRRSDPPLLAIQSKSISGYSTRLRCALISDLPVIFENKRNRVQWIATGYLSDRINLIAEENVE